MCACAADPLCGPRNLRFARSLSSPTPSSPCHSSHQGVMVANVVKEVNKVMQLRYPPFTPSPSPTDPPRPRQDAGHQGHLQAHVKHHCRQVNHVPRAHIATPSSRPRPSPLECPVLRPLLLNLVTPVALSQSLSACTVSASNTPHLVPFHVPFLSEGTNPASHFARR